MLPELIEKQYFSTPDLLASMQNAMYHSPLDPSSYDLLCRRLRGQLVELCQKSKAPHLASALSAVELLAALFGNVLNITATDLSGTDRDRFILSKGHAAALAYAVLFEFGFITKEQLDSYAKPESKLGEQPIPGALPLMEVATGSLGHGLPVGLGMALASKIKRIPYRVFVLMSDGECNEGTVWEAAMMAPAKKLDNLVAIIDFNKWQATGRSEEIMQLSPLKAKWEAFGWSAHEIDGHNLSEILGVLTKVPDGTGRPIAVIAHTTKGKGISFMEDDNNWHYRIPTDEEVITAKKELKLL
ncbi:MAG: transketolase [Candidatus Obscuribacterales bacterium]|nr:transketolase [Candidatus Obscuribacterales bacterium]